VHPFLFDGWVYGHHLKIPSFGVFLAIAFSTAYFLSLRNALRLGVPLRHIENLFLLIILASAIGARLFHVVFEDFSYYLAQPLKILAVWEGGFTFYGSFIASILTLIVYCRTYSVPVGLVFDLAGVSTALSLSIGRIGCFAAGCCWGKVCHFPWAVTFTHPEAFNSVAGVPVHPTQLYESLGAFLIFIWAQKKLLKPHVPGTVGLMILLSSSLVRFCVEWFRGDTYRGFIIPEWLSYSQLISLGLAASALLAFRWLKINQRSI